MDEWQHLPERGGSEDEKRGEAMELIEEALLEQGVKKAEETKQVVRREAEVTLLDQGVEEIKRGSDQKKEATDEARRIPGGSPEPFFQERVPPRLGLAEPHRSTSFHGLGDLDDDRNGVLSNDLRSDEGGKKSESVRRELLKLQGLPLSSSYPLIFSLLENYIGKTCFKSHGKTKPTGDVFPLPSSKDALEGIGDLGQLGLVILRSVVIGLNSYAGCTSYDGQKLTMRQPQFLTELAHDVRDLEGWTEVFEEVS